MDFTSMFLNFIFTDFERQNTNSMHDLYAPNEIQFSINTPNENKMKHTHRNVDHPKLMAYVRQQILSVNVIADVKTCKYFPFELLFNK